MVLSDPTHPHRYCVLGCWLVILAAASDGVAQEPARHSVWLEAEHFSPLSGSNFLFQKVDKTTKGAWSISGPGVAAEWTQGGESEFMSIAARADEPGELVVSRAVEVPAAGRY